ncbi:hypothetical protein Acr_03g0003230 [Actinidia rufa]|uniref:RING-type domain-containing protein n=1 Tax=Actinidia rufa TaxID=165716 RepID=A0A7J0ECG3_9ERIC|nr:hypothetical protein Acr_03g0003230 [Actinidia rufa]
MFQNNGGVINSRKRKEVATNGDSTPARTPFSLQNQRPPQSSLSAALLNRQPPPPAPSQTRSMPFLSFTSLLTDDRSLEIVEQSDQIDEIIKTHSEQLRRKLAEKWMGYYNTLLCAAEESASKKLREREQDLEKTMRMKEQLFQNIAAQSSAEAQAWQAKAQKLEEQTASLSAKLQKANMRRVCGEGGSRQGCAFPEDSESSSADPDRVELVNLACKACRNQVATVMLWPCHHLSVCKECDVVSRQCPVCLAIKTSSVEVCLP